MRRFDEKSPVLFINPIGGLANRMRLLAGGIALAKVLNVDYRIVWLRNWEVYAKFEDLFTMPSEIDGRISYPGQLRYGLLYSSPRRKNIYITKLTLRRYGLSFLGGYEPYFSLSALDNSESIVRNMFKQGFMRRCKCFLQGGTVIYPFEEKAYRCLFVPADDICCRIEERVALLGHKRYGVHIRRTDNAQSIVNSPDDLFLKKMTGLIDQEPDVRFYLSTDSEDVKTKFKRKFGDRVVCSKQVARRDTVEGMKEAVVELFTLSNTQAILGSYFSSFSEAAALLGDIPLLQVKTGC